MDKNRISIGRDSRCDVCIDERWDTVSNQHATIEKQEGALLFYDHSSNGTIINGQKIHNTHVGIYPGDKILLAGVYKLDWGVISNYFPHQHRVTVTRNIHGGEQLEIGRRTVQTAPRSSNENNPRNFGRQTEQFNADSYRGGNPNYYASGGKVENYGQANTYSQADIDKAIEKWNWGAFFCSWLWAAVHRIYWPLLIIIVGCIPYIGQIGSLCLCVYLGLKGSKLAWDSGKYKDFETYQRVQRHWAVGGFIWFILSLIGSAYIVYNTLSIL